MGCPHDALPISEDIPLWEEFSHGVLITRTWFTSSRMPYCREGVTECCNPYLWTGIAQEWSREYDTDGIEITMKCGDQVMHSHCWSQYCKTLTDSRVRKECPWCGHPLAGAGSEPWNAVSDDSSSSKQYGAQAEALRRVCLCWNCHSTDLGEFGTGIWSEKFYCRGCWEEFWNDKKLFGETPGQELEHRWW